MAPAPVLGGDAAVAGRCLSAEEAGRDRFFDTTGDAALDAQIAREAETLHRLFGVKPDVRILDDRAVPNAWASLGSVVPDTLGTVALGRRLLREQIYLGDHKDVALAGVLAHEFAHILQWRLGCRLVGRARELHADYLAGWYLARRQPGPFKSARKLRAFAKKLHAKGDHALASPQHHGTPNERVAALMLGHHNAVAKLEVALRAGEGFVARGPLRALEKDVQLRRSPIWDRVQVPCTHRTACAHRMACTHQIACEHLKECEHKSPCVHRTECTHLVECVHRMQCTHRIACEHRLPCVHVLHRFDLDADGNRVPCIHRAHNWDPAHDYDLKHDYDLAHPDGDAKHPFDFEHEVDYQHPDGDPIHKFDLAHEFDTKHPFDLRHKSDERRTPRPGR